MSAQKIAGSVALVTGANRGIGKGDHRGPARRRRGEGLCRGAEHLRPRKAQAAARRPGRVAHAGRDEQRPGRRGGRDGHATSTLLINNAGVVSAPLDASIADAGHFEAGRQEMEVNYFGVLRLVQAFAPVLARNGGGAIANVGRWSG